MSIPTLHRTARPDGAGRLERTRIVAIGAAAAMAVLYLAIFAGVLSVGRAEAGELGILGVAGGVSAGIALLLWRVRSRPLWVGVAALQAVMFAMYVAIAPERDPSYEVWGVTIRVLSIVLLGAVVTLVVRARER